MLDNVLPEEGGGGLYAYLATNNDHDNLPDIRNEVRKVQSPVLVIQGQCDYIPFSNAYEYVDLYPNSEYCFIENAGHEIWWEKREKYLNKILEFIEK